MGKGKGRGNGNGGSGILDGIKEILDEFSDGANEAIEARNKLAKRVDAQMSSRSGKDLDNPQLGESVEGANGLQHQGGTHTEPVTPDNTPNDNDVPKDSNGEATQSAAETKTNGCPVSMINGEELLTIQDGVLPGAFPFKFSRLYRTTAIEQDIGLGLGWSHSLNHRLEITDKEVIWFNDETAQTHYPLPTQQQPAIYNRLAKSAAYLGAKDGHFVLVKAGLSYIFEKISSSSARLVTIADVHNNRWQLIYDQSNRPSRLTSEHGVGLELEYDGPLLVSIIRLQEKNGVWHRLKSLVNFQFTLTDKGIAQLTSTASPSNSETYEYDPAGVISLRQMASGLSFYWEWEGQGKQVRCIRHWSNSGFDARYQWDEKKKSVEVINSDGSTEVYKHDEDAQLIEQVDPDGAVYKYEYDDDGNLIKEICPMGGVTEHIFNEQGEKKVTIAADGNITRYSYWRGNLTNVYSDITDSQGNTKYNAIEWRYRYNKQGQVISEQSPLRDKTCFTYTEQGLLSKIDHADGRVEHFTYNAAGLLTHHLKKDGSEQRFAYNEDGLVIGEWHSVAGQNGAQWQYKRDAAGRVTVLTDPQGRTRKFEYNVWGKVTRLQDEHGQVTEYEYHPHLPLLLKETQADGHSLQYEYDVRQRFVTCITNQKGERHHISYYPNGHIESETSFDGRKLHYIYDLNGRLISKTEIGTAGTERVTDYKRDLCGRLISKVLPDGQDVSYQYDHQGQLSAVDDGNTLLMWEYDLVGRLLAEHQGCYSQQYEYAHGGQLTGQRLPDLNQIGFTYNEQGLLQDTRLNGELLTQHRYQQGMEVARQQGRRTSQYRYDPQGRLAAQQHSLGDEFEAENLPTVQRHYQYSESGELSEKRDSLRGNQQYNYDPSGQLLSSQWQDDHYRNEQDNEYFHYDSTNNLLQSSNTEIKHNRLLNTASTQYEYDEFGNLIRKVEKALKEQRITTYEYDCQNRLTKASTPDGTIANYSYDAFGRRTEKSIIKPDGQKLTTEFIWQGDRLSYETDNQQKHRCYLYEPDSFKPLALISLNHQGSIHAYEPEADTTLAPDIYYYQNDQLGTPQELTDTNGNIVWAATMLSWGKIQRQLFSKIDNPLRFQGQYHDEETGLHYNRNRYYDPHTARFTTLDPIGLAGGLNNYQYVTNPMGWVDPLGLSQLKNGELPCCGGGQYKYRALTQDQEAQAIKGEPILPKNLDANYSIQEHIDDGSLQTQYNSLGSRKAANFYAKPNPRRGKVNRSKIIKVDTKKIPQGNLHDVSKGIDPSTGLMLEMPGYTYARKDKEVLVEGAIPAEAYEVIDE
ncbi:RHS repeat-associated core domain-containing protein [Neptuniibacter sp. SY11_33]|uniref:RHS repeat-associated core domain-containing protein n=1 Tax=Neptuniibacter sp. SY11_33 TaxID=3398215 RepID=UPI0039F46A99